MKNTGKKILILGTVIAIAVAAILAFMTTIIEPPVDVQLDNLHKSSLQTSINGFTPAQPMEYNDSIYNIVVDKLALYRSEAFLNEQDADNLTSVFVNRYVPVFIKLSNDKFSASVWNPADHQHMLDRIAHLKTIKISNGEIRAIAGAYENELMKVEQVIANYNEALKLAAYKSFTSVADANAKIASADRYRTMNPLSNCVDLTTKLSEVKTNIGNAHYAHVLAKVNQMALYRNISEDDFMSLMDVVNEKIEEYNGNKHNYGPNAKSIEQLRDKAAEYYRKAKEYYERKEIIIYTNNQWSSMSSPSSSYRAYQSFSNYHVDGYDATMYFTIKGYETFSFYIRSNGESGYDYVVVQKDSRPSTYSYYEKSYTSSTTSLSGYKQVTFYGLDKSATTTIYVVYHKDGSNSYYDDRGYVLIPYANN